jgi:hypothetical protein
MYFLKLANAPAPEEKLRKYNIMVLGPSRRNNHTGSLSLSLSLSLPIHKSLSNKMLCYSMLFVFCLLFVSTDQVTWTSLLLVRALLQKGYRDRKKRTQFRHEPQGVYLYKPVSYERDSWSWVAYLGIIVSYKIKKYLMKDKLQTFMTKSLEAPEPDFMPLFRQGLHDQIRQSYNIDF